MADVRRVADHVEHVGRVAGREHAGIGSDFDGIGSVPRGLEDVSKYPDLVRKLTTLALCNNILMALLRLLNYTHGDGHRKSLLGFLEVI